MLALGLRAGIRDKDREAARHAPGRAGPGRPQGCMMRSGPRLWRLARGMLPRPAGRARLHRYSRSFLGLRFLTLSSSAPNTMTGTETAMNSVGSITTDCILNSS